MPGALEGRRYPLLAMFQEEIRAAILVHESGQVKALPELSGRSVAAPSRAAVLSMVGEDLIRRGIAPYGPAPAITVEAGHC